MLEFETLYSLVQKKALAEPELTAFVSGNKRYSYHQLLYFIDRASDMFWRLKIRKNDKVAIVLKNSIEFIISYFALSKIGAISVPINFLISSQKEIEFMLSNSHSKGVVTETDFLKNYIKMPKKIPELEFILCVGDSPEKGALNFWKCLHSAHYYPETHKEKSVPNDLISVLYTSGTTGNPKGVMLTHCNLISNVTAAAKVIHSKENDVFMCLLPMFHTLAWTTNVILPIYLGTKTLIIRNITPPKKWLNEMGKEGVSIMVAIPQIYSLLAKEKGLKKIFLKYWAFRNLRLCISGAAPLSNRIKRDFEKTFKVHLLEGYGLTETSPVVSVNHPKDKKEGSVGRPLPGVQIKIVDEQSRILKPGEEGEICVKGPNVTAGYYADETATTELFTEDGWLKTGDIGIVDHEGFLFIKDRKKDMIISKGLKVFPAQIENLLNMHPKVRESAVVGLPHGEDDDEVIKCYCVPKENVTLEKEEIQRFIKENLDVYKRPKEIEIVKSLPKNTLQKVLKHHLKEQELAKQRPGTHEKHHKNSN